MTLLQDLQYKILIETNSDIIELLSNTSYGTKGLKYGHKDVEDRTRDIDNADFHTLYKENELLAVAVYCHRDISMPEQMLKGIYIRYFSVKEGFQGQGLGQYLTEQIAAHYKKTITSPTIGYAYIETKNARSLAVSKKFEQKEIGTFRSIYFSRFFPKTNKQVKTISRDEALALLKDNHNKYACYNSLKIGYKNGYSVLEKNGEIVAGLQANKVRWRIDNLPGTMGWLTRNVFHFLPVIGRLCPRTHYNFVGFEGIYVKDGYTKDLFALMAHCLAERKVNSAVMALDEQDDFFKLLYKHPNLGLMSKLQKAHPFSILINELNLSETTLTFLKQKPKYFSVFDIT